MRNKFIALALVVSLGGCHSLTSLAPDASLNTEKALTIAHIAYNGVGNGLMKAVSFGVLKGADAAKAKVFFDKAGVALDAADKADKAANDTDVVKFINDAQDAIASASAFTKGN